MKKTLTTGEIAKYCDVHYRTVIRWIERGEMRSHKLPGRGDNRVQVDDFIAFLKKNGLPVPEDLQNQSIDILIVEHDSQFAALLQKIVERAGFSCMIADDGFHAGVLLGMMQPTMMLVDVSVPGMNGFTVLKTIRNEANLAATKIIVLTATGQERMNEALRVGADAVLQKPFDNEILLSEVNRLM